MNYLGDDYLLRRIVREDYVGTARKAVLTKRAHGIEQLLLGSLEREHGGLTRQLMTKASNIHEAYGDGGGMYLLVVATSIAALRLRNSTVQAIGPAAWEMTMGRGEDSVASPDPRTHELSGEQGLLAVKEVNPGYVEGYEAVFHRPGFMAVRSLVDLAAVHAHDLMHFASQERPQEQSTTP